MTKESYYPILKKETEKEIIKKETKNGFAFFFDGKIVSFLFFYEQKNQYFQKIEVCKLRCENDLIVSFLTCMKKSPFKKPLKS